MNVERLKAEAERLRNWDIANPGVTFDISQYYDNTCGIISCCIAGDIALTHSKGPIAYRLMYQFAKDYLDLNDEQADWLFFAHFSDAVLLEDITPEEAADAIDALIANPNIGDDID